MTPYMRQLPMPRPRGTLPLWLGFVASNLAAIGLMALLLP